MFNRMESENANSHRFPPRHRRAGSEALLSSKLPIMPRLPSQLTYNDLNGAEATDAILDWVRQLLASQPLLQPHLTLPMADISISLHISIDMYVGGTVPVSSPPDTLSIDGSLKLSNQLSDTHPIIGALEHEERVLSARVNAAPIPGGQPPDQIRERHGLPVSRPGYGPRDTGSHLFLADIAEQTDASQTRASLPVEEASANVRQGIVAD